MASIYYLDEANKAPLRFYIGDATTKKLAKKDKNKNEKPNEPFYFTHV